MVNSGFSSCNSILSVFIDGSKSVPSMPLPFYDKILNKLNKQIIQSPCFYSLLLSFTRFVLVFFLFIFISLALQSYSQYSVKYDESFQMSPYTYNTNMYHAYGYDVVWTMALALNKSIGKIALQVKIW